MFLVTARIIILYAEWKFFSFLKVYSDHIKIYIQNRNQKLTQMTYYCIGSESDAVIWKEEERERERERERRV